MAPLVPYLFGFLLVLFRTAGLCATAPLFGLHLAPGRIRIAIAIALAGAAFAGAGFPGFGNWARLEALAACAASEALVGLTAGATARLALEAATAAGHIASLSMGLSFGSVVDPVDGAESTAIAQLLGLLALAAVVAAGGHREMIAWLCRSIVAQPPGSPIDVRALAMGVVDGSLSGVALSVRLAFPVMSAVLVGQVLLGVVGRAAPQLNIGSVGFSLTILAGGAVLYVSMPLAAEIAARAAITSFARGH
jgi:flagellar biosynthetic protein FliR